MKLIFSFVFILVTQASIVQATENELSIPTKPQDEFKAIIHTVGDIDDLKTQGLLSEREAILAELKFERERASFVSSIENSMLRDMTAIFAAGLISTKIASYINSGLSSSLGPSMLGDEEGKKVLADLQSSTSLFSQFFGTMYFRSKFLSFFRWLKPADPSSRNYLLKLTPAGGSIRHVEVI